MESSYNPKDPYIPMRAASGALAVAERLTAHGMPVEMTCKLCNQGIETIEHVLFKCDKAQEMWREFSPVICQAFQDLTLVELLNICLQLMEGGALDQSQRQAIPWMLWTIWKNRNSLLYAEVQESKSSLVQNAIEESVLWHEVNKTEDRGAMGPSDLGVPKHWTPPVPGVAKCNIYANWRSSRYLSGGAWITRDHRGAVGMHARDAFVPSPDKLSADMSCMLWALRSLKDLRIEELSIGTDSQKLVEAIKNPSRWPRYRCLLQQIAAISADFGMVSFEVESGESNSGEGDSQECVGRWTIPVISCNGRSLVVT